MSHVPTPAQALAIVDAYNQEEFHRIHARTVAAVMRWFAARHDPGAEDYWYAVGALHDVDFERYPERHCVAGVEILTREGVDEGVIRAAMSHGWGLSPTPFEPERLMEKVLFATDELTGIIWACALVRPSKSTLDMRPKSVKKKFKSEHFAAGCSREVIRTGAERLGWTVDELIARTLEAMQDFEREESGLLGATVAVEDARRGVAPLAVRPVTRSARARPPDAFFGGIVVSSKSHFLGVILDGAGERNDMSHAGPRGDAFRASAR